MSYQQPPQLVYQPPPPAHGTQAPSWTAPSRPAHWIVPVGRSWQSIVAGYVALVALVVWPLGPVALGLGGWAFAKARHGGHGRGRATFAVVVGAVTTGLLLLILAYAVM